jgi:hypothetical protein
VLPYFATVLLGRSEGFAFDLGASLGGMMAVGMAVMPRLVNRFGSKPIMVACFGLFAAASAALGLIRPDVPGGPDDAWNLAVVFTALGAMGVPLAGISILPNVLLGQLIDDDARRTGTNRSAIYLGMVRAFDKWAGQSGGGVDRLPVRALRQGPRRVAGGAAHRTHRRSRRVALRRALHALSRRSVQRRGRMVNGSDAAPPGSRRRACW